MVPLGEIAMHNCCFDPCQCWQLTRPPFLQVREKKVLISLPVAMSNPSNAINQSEPTSWLDVMIPFAVKRAVSR